MTRLHTKRISGAALQNYLPELAELRIRVFREFPYLYEGSADYERKYLQKYAESPYSVIVIAKDGEKIVGASSGLPLADEVCDTTRPFVVEGHDLNEIFYFGESVLLPQYRGHGLGIRFFEEREDHAASLNQFNRMTFCAVERPLNHPRRPKNYIPLDSFWERRGYQKQPQLRTEYVWRDLDEPVESPKPMVFWVKEL